MYNKKKIEQLVEYIHSLNGIGDKKKLSELVKEKFNLTKDSSVFYDSEHGAIKHFAIRFNQSNSDNMSNTVLALSKLQKYDHIPFIVCIVTAKINYMLLANTTFLKKISQSSKELRFNNIKGSFNGSDIIRNFGGYQNQPINFEKLFSYHSENTFEDNLERLVESTNGIVSRVRKYDVTEDKLPVILDAVKRAKAFIDSKEYEDLNQDLNNRVRKVQGEIAIAAFIENVNIRGRIIEYLITDDGSTLKEKIIQSLHNSSPLPKFKTEDKLGDYSKKYASFNTETDIKTKLLFLKGNPKAFNIDKLLEFLAFEKSVYMIYLLGIDEHKKIVARLCSVFDSRIIEATKVVHHWAGRNSRGVTQFMGPVLVDILKAPIDNRIEEEKAQYFVESLIKEES